MRVVTSVHMCPLCVHIAGGSYERVLRKQHAVLNPRTGWASLNKKNAKKRAAGSDEDPDDTDLQVGNC